MLLRQYQIEAKKALTESYQKNEKNGILSLPTGAGKTLTASSWVYDVFLSQGKNVVWAAHRTELLDQAYEVFKRIDPNLDIKFWNATNKEIGQLTIVSIPSAKNFPKINAGCTVLDEAHHQESPTWTKFAKSHKFEYKLGLTACPERMDGKALKFNKIIYSKSLLDLVKLGYAPKPRPYMVYTNNHYSMARSKGDFTGESLKKLDNEIRNKIIIDEYLKHKEEYGKTLLFACNRENMLNLEKLAKEKDPTLNILSICSKMGTKQREQEVKKILNGNYDLVINIGIFTEGFDYPECNTTILGRPTLSKNLYLQMCGRSARLSPGAHNVEESEKKHFNIVHIVDEIHRYTNLCEDWSVTLLGNEDKKIRQKVSANQEEEKIKEALKDHGLTEKSPATKKAIGIERKLFEIAAVGTYSNKFQWNRKIVLTKEDLRTLEMLRLYVQQSDNPYQAINSSWALFNEIIELDPSEWKSLCWSWYFKNYKYTHQIKCEEGKDKGKEGKTFELTVIEDISYETNELQKELNQLLEEHNKSEIKIASNAKTWIESAKRYIQKTRIISNANLFTFDNYQNKCFTLKYSGPLHQAYKCKKLLESYLSKVSEENISVKIKS